MEYLPVRIRPIIWIVLLFLLAGLAFLRKTGLHYDASYELACFYSCSQPAFRLRLFNHWEPVMVIQYLGALKAWLYLPILKLIDVTPFVLRLPFLICGAASVWLFYSILDRVSGRKAAIAGALLLSTDASYLLATCYDFGPVVMLHLALLAAMALLLRFEKTLDNRLLALAFLVLGLAMWHKALFIWMLGGLGVASAAVFPGRIRALITPRRIAVAAFWLATGALPLLYYNVIAKGATLHPGNIAGEPAPLSQKLLVLRRTVDGSILSGWLTENAHPETALPPVRLREKLSVNLDRAAGGRRSDWMPYALLASFCLVPWLWFTPSRRPALFAVIYLAVAWTLMIILPTTGGTLHHVILLWPIPHFLVAITGAEIAAHAGKLGRLALAAALVVLAAANALVINGYYADLATRGTSVLWTDAVNPLFEYLDALDGKRIIAVDWGYSTTLCLLSDGEMPVQEISDILLQPSPIATLFVRSLVAGKDTIFVDHMADGEVFPGVRERLGQIAADAGYTKRVIDLIVDRNHRPRFEISRYERAAAPASPPTRF